MRKVLYSLIVLLLANRVIAFETATSCLQKISTLSGPIESLNKEITSCGYNKGLVELEKIQDDQRKYVYDKLADKLTTKLIQNSEETALLTTYFNSNGDDLLMKDADPNGNVKRECSLNAMKEIEKCGGGKKGQYYDLKLNLLKNKLNPNNTSSRFGNDLYGILANKFVNNMGISKSPVENNLSCPLDGGVSGFILQSQIDDLSALDIIAGAKGSKDAFESSFNSYAQLKLIKNAGNEAVEKFKNYLLNMPKGATPKVYIAKFFTDKENQKKYFAPTLAGECEAINKNVNKFLCSDLDDLGSVKSKTSIDMFNKLDVAPMDDQYEIDFENDPVTLRAYGFQCLSQVKNKLLSESQKKKEQTLDNWYDDFTNNTRPEISQDKDKDKNLAFCANYSCSSEESKKAPSCKSGGPLSSIDLKIIMGCPAGEKCKSDALKSIDYLASLEKIKVTMGAVYGDNSSSSQTPDQIKKAKSELPDFAENYLGVEGSLIALGKPVTPITLAEKTQDFKDRQLNPTAPPYEAPGGRVEIAKNNEEGFSGNSNFSIPETGSANVSVSRNNYTAPSSNYTGPIQGIHGKNKSNKASKPKDENNDFWWDDSKDAGSKNNGKAASADNTTAKEGSAAVVKDKAEFTKAEFDEYKKQVNSELSANRSKISSVSNELARTQQELANQRAEMERRLTDLERRQNDLKNSTDPKEQAQASALKKDANNLRTQISNINREPAAVQSGGGVIVTPEKLKDLKEEELQNMGVDIEESFVIAVKVKEEKGKGEKLVNIPVIRHNSNGKSYLIPRYNGKNEEIMKAIEKSPLFKDFIREIKTKMKTFTSLRDLIK